MPGHMPKSLKTERAVSRKVSLFRNGRNQAMRIPREFEFPCKEVIIRKESDHIIVEPVPAKAGLLSLLSTLDPIEESLPEVDEGLLDNDEINL